MTHAGWKELHNPASMALQIKMFTTSNLGATATASKKLTLVDGGASINVGESMKEIISLEELKQAVRVLVKAAHFALPWNMSFSALEGFLISSNWCAASLAAHTDRVSILADFINYVLTQNATAWQQKEPFLSQPDVKQTWDAWSSTRVAITLTTPAAPSTPQSGSGKRSFWGGKRTANSTPAGTSQPSTPTTPATPQQPRLPPLCRRYNNGGNCPNPHMNCMLPGGLKLAHACDKNKADGTPCRGKHPGSQHR